MVHMYRAKSPNSQFGGTDHSDTMEGTEQLTKDNNFFQNTEERKTEVFQGKWCQS